jgi:membrane-bound metal-dependent hydrolase YbcI (DUF457 family)
MVPTPPQFLVLILGSLAPDIDGGGAITRPGTILRRFFPWRIVKIFDSFGLAIGALAQSIASHRGLFHWPILGILMMMVGLSFKIVWLFWFGLGYLSHILADALTKGGVPLYAPFDLSRRSFLSFKSGSWIEAVLSFWLFIYSVAFGWQFLPVGVRQAFSRIGVV